jgi:hypothetical protein
MRLPKPAARCVDALLSHSPSFPILIGRAADNQVKDRAREAHAKGISRRWPQRGPAKTTASRGAVTDAALISESKNMYEGKRDNGKAGDRRGDGACESKIRESLPTCEQKDGGDELKEDGEAEDAYGDLLLQLALSSLSFLSFKRLVRRYARQKEEARQTATDLGFI